MADTNVFQVSSTSSSSAAPSGVTAAPARVSAEAEIDQFFEELLNSSWSSGVVASAKTGSKGGGSSSSAGTQAYEDKFDVEAHIENITGNRQSAWTSGNLPSIKFNILTYRTPYICHGAFVKALFVNQ